MSLINFIISNPETTHLLQGRLAETVFLCPSDLLSWNVTSFAGLLFCVYALVCLVYLGAMAILGLLSNLYHENKQQLLALQRLVEKQDQQIEALRKELETQKDETQTMYNTLTFDSTEKELKLRLHAQQIADHSNDLLSQTTCLNANTTISANHSEALKNILQYIFDQNQAICATHLAVEKQSGQLQTMETLVDKLNALSEQVLHYTCSIEAIDQSFAEFSEQMAFSQAEIENKLEILCGTMAERGGLPEIDYFKSLSQGKED
jgi:DNA repair exonuclease SbcCD ATPase subunit